MIEVPLIDRSMHANHDSGIRLNRRDFLRTAGGTATALALGRTQAFAQSLPAGPGVIRFAVIGDFGQTFADQTFPLDHVAAMIRSWNPDFVVSVGDNNYQLGLAATADVNIGKNFSAFIYPKSTEIPVEYPHPPGAPLYNRFIPCLGNHDYGDVQNTHIPTTANVALSQPYLDYFRRALREGLSAAPNTTVAFADHAVGQTYKQGFFTGEVEDYAPFSEAQNLRFFDVRLGTASGPGSVHLFVFDSNPTTPYGRFHQNRPVPNRDGSDSPYTEIATQGAWLQRRLASSTARWKIVIFHDPPYNSAAGAENAAYQYTYMRWPFQAWGATAVISGHVHNYERLEMPDADADGQPLHGQPTIPYFVNGAGGFIPEQGFDPSFVIRGSKVRVSQYGAQLVTADDNSINFLFFDLDGVLRDVKTIYASPQTGASQVEFSGREFPVNAAPGTVQIPVTRLGDASQPLSVDFATVDGTALAGVNYVATSGTLHFAAHEREKTIPVTIEPPPVFGPGVVPWESLIFSVTLTSPTPGILGFFSLASVILVNTVNTPLTDQGLFIVQTFRDLFQVDPTPAELAAAGAAIGAEDLALARAKWIYQLLISNDATEPVFRVAQIYAPFILSVIAVIENRAIPPSFADLQDGIHLYLEAADTDDALTKVSTAFNQNLLEVFNDKVPGFATDNTLFIQTIYLAAIARSSSEFSQANLSSAANQADLRYWLPLLESGTPAELAARRNLMLGRISTQRFDPPPAAGMTPFDLTAKNKNAVRVSMVLAGLLRQQLTYPDLFNGYLFPVDQGGETILIDHIYNIIQSADYAARFRVTSYEGFIDSVKGGLPPDDRLPGADPEGDGLTNFEEYSFALADGPSATSPVTGIEIENSDGQTYALFSYRQAANVKRVEFVVLTSNDLKTWSVASNAVASGGVDMGTYIKRRVRIGVPASTDRLFIRLVVRPRS
ncbi:MAG: metallophosphoesterase [Verrucomicrobiae bacterium]|nr:metallophosphoesterase [Verrucomicrobiae bacterium]